MIAIVLAAGAGNRLGGRAKGLIPADDGQPLMRHALRNMEKHVDSVLLITGKYNCCYDAAYTGTGIELDRVRNHFWGDAGNIGSVWTALNHIGDEPYIICNGDVVTSAESVDTIVRIAGETGKGIGVLKVQGLPKRTDYAGIACVIGRKEQEEARRRVNSLLQQSQGNREARNAIGHCDVFYHSVNGFEAKSIVLIASDQRIEIDTPEDFIEFYEGRRTGRWKQIFENE